MKTAKTSNTLDSTLAGSWYPATAAGLDRLLDKALRQAGSPSRTSDVPNILVLPHAGYTYAARTAAHGLRRIMGAAFNRVVVLAPSHHLHTGGRLIVPEATAVATPYGTIPLDCEYIDTVAADTPVARNDAAHTREHSAQILFPMLQYALKSFTLAPFIVGDMPETAMETAAAALRGGLDDGTLLVVSSDFTHYGRDFGYAPFGNEARAGAERVDTGAFERLRAGSPKAFRDYLDATQATICGRFPLYLTLKMLPPGTILERLHYETSADGDGDFSRFVCYMAIAGCAKWGKGGDAKETAASATAEMHLTDEEKRSLLSFAHRSIAHTLETQRLCPADFFADEATGNMRREAGCFVTLNTRAGRELRGCIGEMEARRPLYQAVTEMAGHAAFRDPRFHPLRRDEFDQISLEISVLTPMHPVASWREIEIGRHGMTLSKGGRAAVFLPQVAVEQGWTLEETLSHLSLKAGLGRDAWREGAAFTVFEAVVFGEEP